MIDSAIQSIPLAGRHPADVLSEHLAGRAVPFIPGERIGVKLHWGERGNKTHLSPRLAQAVVKWLRDGGCDPYVFDTTVLYAGGRRTGQDSLRTAAENGFSAESLGCDIVIADGMDGRRVVDTPAGYRHFRTVQVADVFSQTQGFVILSHFKGHLAAGFGGAIKNLSMGFASRAQKQRMHADVRPVLKTAACTRCGFCASICPAGAIGRDEGGYPLFSESRCEGCAQCIALCPQIALKILWDGDDIVFQEKLVETAAAVWKQIAGRTLFINALINVVTECDCLPGTHPAMAPDFGFLMGNHPVTIDRTSLTVLGSDPFDKAHPGVSWRRQFAYAREIGFSETEG